MYADNVILPEDIYQLFVMSDPPENFPEFGAFGCQECQAPIGINKPEGIADLPPYMPKKQRTSDGNPQQQNHNKQPHNKYTFQRVSKFKQQQQQHQQQQKKIVSTVEVSPEFANKNLGTWAKKPALSPTSSTPAAVAPKSSSGFNPEKAPSATPHSSTSFNPQIVPSKSTSSNSSSTPLQPEQEQSEQPSQQPQFQPQTIQPTQQQPQTKQSPPPPKQEPSLAKHSSGWGNVQSRPKMQSFAELLKSEESKPSPKSTSSSFKPESIARTTEQAPVPNDDKNFPSLSALNNTKKNSAWGNFKP